MSLNFIIQMKTLKFIQNARPSQDSHSASLPKKRTDIKSVADRKDSSKQKSPVTEETRRAPQPHPHPNSVRKSQSPNVTLTEDELKDLVVREAHSTCVDDYVSLVHLLNTFDLVMKEIHPKPPADVANSVYRKLLQTEKSKTYASIQSIQCEIEGLQQIGLGGSHHTKSETSIKKNETYGAQRLSTYHTASFAADDLTCVDEQHSTKNSNDDKEDQKQLASPILVVQRHVNMFRNHAITSMDSKSTDRSARQKADSNSEYHFGLNTYPDKIRQYLFLSGSGGRTSPLNGSKFSSLVNTFSPKTVSQEFEVDHKNQQTVTLSGFQLIEEINRIQRCDSFIKRCQKLELIMQKTQLKRTKLNKDLVCVKASQKLPKIKLVSSPTNSTSSSEELFFNTNQTQKVIDSNRALAVAYQARRLLIKGLKAIQSSIFEQKARSFVLNVCKQTYAKSQFKKVLAALFINKEIHRGHRQRNLQASLFRKYHSLRSFTNSWKQKYDIISTDRIRIKRLKLKSSTRMKRMIFQAWNQYKMQTKVQKMQKQTARHLRKKQLQLKVYHTLRSYAKHSIAYKYRDMRTKSHNMQRILKLGFSAWIAYHENKKDVNRTIQLFIRGRMERVKSLVFQQLSMNRNFNQHLRQLTSLATEFSLRRLIRSCYLQIQLFASYQAERRLRIARARTFYQTKLKKSLINLLHESNLEFIRRTVHCEMYFERYWQRKVFQTISVYAKRRNAVINCSGFQQYCISMWLKNRSFQLSRSLKYQAKYQKSQNAVKKFIQSSVFIVWKSESERVRNVTQKSKYKNIRIIIDRWQSWASSAQNNKKKADRFRNQKLRFLQQDVFEAFRLTQSRARVEKIACAKIMSLCTFNSMKKPFLCWNGKFKVNQLKRDQKALARKMGNTSVTKKFFEIWIRKKVLQDKKQDLLFKKKLFEKEKRCKTFLKWLKQVLQSIENNKKAQRFNENLKQKTKKSVLTILKQKSQSKQILDRTIAVFRSNQEYDLSRIVFKAWRQKFIPEQKVKKQLFICLKKDRDQRCLKNCFSVLGSFTQFKRQQKARDLIVTHFIQQISSRKAIKAWQKQYQYRAGLKHVSNILPGLQIVNAFRTLQFNSSMHDLVNLHLKQRAIHFSMQTVFGALKRYSKRHLIRQEKVQAVQEISKVLLKKQFLRMWRSKYQRIVKTEFNVHRCIVAVARELKSRVFRLLKHDHELETKLREFTENKRVQRTQACYKAILTHSKLVSTGRLYHQYQTTNIKRQYFANWIDQLRTLQFIEEAQKLREISGNVQNYQSWSCSAKHQQNSYQKALSYLKSRNFSLAQTSMAILRQYATQSKNQRETVFRNMQRRQIRTKSYVLTQMQLQANYSKQLRSTSLTVRQNHQACCRRTIFKSWFKQAERRINLYREQNQIAQQFYHRVQTNNLYLIVKNFRENALQKSIKRARINSIKQYANNRLLTHAFAHLKQGTEHQRIRNFLDNKARLYRQLSLQQRSISVLRSHSQETRRNRSIVFLVESNRLLPLAFTSLKFNLHLARVARGLRLKAMKFRERKLLFCAMEGFVANRNLSKDKKRMLAGIEIMYLQKLIRQKFDDWRMRLFQKQYIRGKREHLYNAIQSVDQQVIQKVYFNYLRVAVLTSQQRWLKALVIKDKFMTARVFQNWLEVMKTQRLQTIAAQMTKKNCDQSLKKKMLRLWFSSFSMSVKCRYLVHKQQLKTQRLVLTSLKCRVQKRLTIKLVDLHSEGLYYKKVWQALLINQEDMEQRRQAMSHAELAHYEKLLTRCLLALKFNVVIQKGARLLAQKNKQTLKLKAWEALRYNQMRSNILKSYIKFRENKIRAQILKALAVQLSIQRQASVSLLELIKKKVFTERFTAFRSWKKQTFLQKTCELMRNHIEGPSLQEKVVQIVFAWRKYAYLRRNQNAFVEVFQKRARHSLKAKFLTMWYQKLLSQLPSRILVEKLESVQKLYNLRSGFAAVAQIAVARRALQIRAVAISDQRAHDQLIKSYKLWRKAFLCNKAQRILVQRKKRRVYQSTILIWFNKMVQTKRDRKEMSAFDNQEKVLLLKRQLATKQKIFQKWRETTTEHKEILQLTAMRKLSICFNALQDYAIYRQERKAIKQQLNDNALETRAHTLTKKAFYALRSNRQPIEQNNDRSRLYSIFSNWKFYTKERSLLKRYLIECGESPTNMSLLSNDQMREQAEIQSQNSRPQLVIRVLDDQN